MIIRRTGAPVASTTLPCFSTPNRLFRTGAPPACKTSAGRRYVKRPLFAQHSTTRSHSSWDWTHTFARGGATGHSISSKRQRWGSVNNWLCNACQVCCSNFFAAFCRRECCLQLLSCNGLQKLDLLRLVVQLGASHRFVPIFLKSWRSFEEIDDVKLQRFESRCLGGWLLTATFSPFLFT